MRKTITEEKIQYILRHFATDRNEEIASVTGLHPSTVYRIAKKAGLEKTPQYLDEVYGRIVLSEKQLDILLTQFKNTDNFLLASDLGISESTLHRLARRYGLKKSKSYMKQMQAEAVLMAKYNRENKGTGPQKGVYNENLQKGRAYLFKPGENNRMRNGAVNERHRLQKAAITRLKTIKEERERIKAGLPQKTKLKLTVR